MIPFIPSMSSDIGQLTTTPRSRSGSEHKPGQLSPWEAVRASPFLLRMSFGPSFLVYRPGGGGLVGQDFWCLPRALPSGLTLSFAELMALPWFVSASRVLFKRHHLSPFH